jgi:hypothetical protein
VPREHASASVLFDEEVFEELQYFKKHLIKMFAAEKPPRLPVFIETVYSVASQAHAIIECVPLPKNEYLDAPIYFKKAILEADEEWSQHRKLIDTHRKGGFRTAVPKGFPYFSVEFGTDGSSAGGYAHVIEDVEQFSRSFGLDILCGMLGESPQIVLRQRKQPFAQEQLRCTAFAKQWKRFDWTRRLAGGDLHGKSAVAASTTTAAAAARTRPAPDDDDEPSAKRVKRQK